MRFCTPLTELPSASVSDGGFKRVTVRVENAVARTRARYVASALAGLSLEAIGTSYAGTQP